MFTFELRQTFGGYQKTLLNPTRSNSPTFKTAKLLEILETAVSSPFHPSPFTLHPFGSHQGKLYMLPKRSSTCGMYPAWKDKEAPTGLAWRLDIRRPDVSKEVLTTIDLSHSASTLIGRKSPADVVLDHQSISRKHASLFFGKGGSLFCMCLGSTHGTTVNSTSLNKEEAVEVVHGDVISFGKSSKLYEVQKYHVSKEGKNNEKQESSSDDDDDDDDDSFGPMPQMPQKVRVLAEAAPFKRAREEEKNILNTDDGQSTIEAATTMKAGAAAARAALLPVSHEVTLHGHTKAVSCVSVESKGSRVVTSSLDCNLQLFDFGGMDSSHRAFRQLTPMAGIGVNFVVHSRNNDRLLVVLSNSQPFVYDRDGTQLIKFIKGDMYLRDLSHTKGHTTETTGAAWHPSFDNVLITSSQDGSVRLWDLSSPLHLGSLQCKSVYKVRSAPGATQLRIGVTCCCFSHDAKYIIAGCSDGSIQIWDKNLSSRTKAVIRPYAGSTQEFPICSVMTTSCNVSADVRGDLICRGQDGTVFLYSLNKLQEKNQQPFQTIRGCICNSAAANFALSPDEQILCIPTNAISKDENAHLCFYSIDATGDMKKPSSSNNDYLIARIPLDRVQVATFVTWVSLTQQIFVATGDGKVKVFFDPEFSSKGALLSFSREHIQEVNDTKFFVSINEENTVFQQPAKKIKSSTSSGASLPPMRAFSK